ncbi:hypothetical protein GCE86_13055 [Micromonospora terminaliae]|uniref:Uncharacterized protein n=1 Tax=Micromonospora terminaliae TaxID=1914461 RepID=A0AAJ2ZBW2_9ACTN|nr:hypothetical protein [Micromonospora terminaliae]NES27385.1 hypothetical protein [Micromonospora terminaliae]QGL47872.1 hypothetical protein GCE86_13055 [Micromonospora terminaliae]
MDSTDTATEPRWIIHLPTTLTRLDQATALAVALRESLRHVTAVDFGETTLSEEDRQFVRTRVWCDARLPGDARCLRPADHDGACGAITCEGRGVHRRG